MTVNKNSNLKSANSEKQNNSDEGLTGLFLGRFQPLHKGHIWIIENALNEVANLKIAVGSSQAKHKKLNPFSADERLEMFNRVFKKQIRDHRLSIFFVPDINCDDRYVDHLKKITGPFEVVYAADNEQTFMLFSQKGYKVKRHERINNYSSTEIRKRIHDRKDWIDLVDRKVYDYVLSIKGESRIINI